MRCLVDAVSVPGCTLGVGVWMGMKVDVEGPDEKVDTKEVLDESEKTGGEEPSRADDSVCASAEASTWLALDDGVEGAIERGEDDELLLSVVLTEGDCLPRLTSRGCSWKGRL